MRVAGPGREARVLVVTLSLFVAAAAGAALAPTLEVAVPLLDEA